MLSSLAKTETKVVKQSTAIAWRAVCIGVLGYVLVGRSALADNPKQALPMTVYVYNWAEIERGTLTRTKEAARQVFQEAGVTAELHDLEPVFGEEESASANEFKVGSMFVHIFPRKMTKQLRLPVATLGLAPGTHEDQGRNLVYVFEHVAERMAQEHQEQVMARVDGSGMRHAEKSQILGHAIAHEIGHILLRQEQHASEGLMRGVWDRDHLEQIAMGKLRFTPEEAQRVRSELSGRNFPPADGLKYRRKKPGFEPKNGVFEFDRDIGERNSDGVSIHSGDSTPHGDLGRIAGDGYTDMDWFPDGERVVGGEY